MRRRDGCEWLDCYYRWLLCAPELIFPSQPSRSSPDMLVPGVLCCGLFAFVLRLYQRSVYTHVYHGGSIGQPPPLWCRTALVHYPTTVKTKATQSRRIYSSRVYWQRPRSPATASCCIPRFLVSSSIPGQMKHPFSPTRNWIQRFWSVLCPS